MNLKSIKQNKKGQVSGLVAGVIGLIFTVVITFVLVQTVLDSNLLTSGGTYETSAVGLTYNLSDGVVSVGNKIPTILLIASVVLLFGVLAVLVLQARRMGMFGGGSGI